MSESYVYNIDSSQSRDILNQGSIPYIQQYFDKLEKQRQQELNPLAEKNIYTFVPDESPYSINSTSFAIKFIALILLIIIFCDFIKIT